jgi:hypothetical protein
MLLTLIGKRTDENTNTIVRNYQLQLALNEKEIASCYLRTQQVPSPPLVTSPPKKLTSKHHVGVIILGMHRSGTSIIGGLMSEMGLKTGGPLIAPAIDNEKGFFERIDVVLQNDVFMKHQQIWYASNVEKYDHLQGLKLVFENDGIEFAREGKKALNFLNNPLNYPYMLKDPRLCITLRTWLPLLTSLPAILFTYRHPLDVALSLSKREQEHFHIVRGLKLWYIYNRRAIEQSNDLCRVVASHKSIMTDPVAQLDRIYTELREECGVNVPNKVSETIIKSFIDIRLQHGNTGVIDSSCTENFSTLMPPTTWPTTDEKELSVYREAMRVFCGMQSGDAFAPTFLWDKTMR